MLIEADDEELVNFVSKFVLAIIVLLDRLLPRQRLASSALAQLFLHWSLNSFYLVSLMLITKAALFY